MPDALNPIVQKMIDAGESEDNIATVIRHYKAQAAPSVVSPNEPGTFVGGFVKSLKDQFSDAVQRSMTTDENGMLAPTVVSPGVKKMMTTPLAHPTGFDTIDGFTSPAGLAGLVTMAGAHIAGSPSVRGSVGRGLQTVGEFDMTKPLKIVGRVGQAMEQSAGAARNAAITQERYLPNKSGYVQTADSGAATSHVPYAAPTEPAPIEVDRYLPSQSGLPTQATATPSSSRIAYAPQTEVSSAAAEAHAPSTAAPVSDLDLARREVAAGRLPQSALAAIERAQQAPPATPPGMIRGTLRPVTVAPERPMQPPAAQPNPLQQPRVQVGADALARGTAQTPTDIRVQAGPVGAEAVGAPREGMPDKPFERVFNSSLERERGSGRASYADANNSEKTRIQTNAIARAQDYIGKMRDSMPPEQFSEWIKKFVLAGATTGASMSDSIRRAVMDRLSGRGSSQ